MHMQCNLDSRVETNEENTIKWLIKLDVVNAAYSLGKY